MEILQDGFGARDTMETLGRMVANVENAFDDQLRESGRRSVAGARVAGKHFLIVWGSLAKPFGPFLDPRERAAKRIGEILEDPVGSQVKQVAQASAVDDQLGVHHTPPASD